MLRLKHRVKPATPGQPCVAPHIACEPVGTVNVLAETSMKGFSAEDSSSGSDSAVHLSPDRACSEGLTPRSGGMDVASEERSGGERMMHSSVVGPMFRHVNYTDPEKLMASAPAQHF